MHASPHRTRSAGAPEYAGYVSPPRRKVFRSESEPRPGTKNKKPCRGDKARCAKCGEVRAIQDGATVACRKCVRVATEEKEGVIPRKRTRPGSSYNKDLTDAAKVRRRHSKNQPRVQGCLRQHNTRCRARASEHKDPIYTVATYVGGGLADVPFSKPPYQHVYACDINANFKAAVEANLGTTFEVLDMTKATAASVVKKITTKIPSGSHLHYNSCLCCKDASTANGRECDYEQYESDIRKVANIKDRLAMRHHVSFFGEFIVNSSILRIFRKYFPSADMQILEVTGQEKRKRLYIADGFSIHDLQEEVDLRLQKSKPTERLIGRGEVKSNTGQYARWTMTSELLPTITCTGLKYKHRSGKVQEVSKEALLELRSQGAKHRYDISMVTECLGRTIVGQAVTPVVAEAIADLCARAHGYDSNTPV